jgi:hypothetical protein
VLIPSDEPLTSRSADGRKIDETDDLEKAQSSIHQSLEPDSNVIVERELHLSKLWWQILSTEEGIQIDESDEQSQNA